MEKPELYHLTRIRWQFFGTLTFRAAEVPERIRLCMWFSAARKCAEGFGLYFPTLPWCLRQEQGETNGRRHFHVLLGGLPEQAVQIQTCFALMAQWEAAGGGMARYRLFNPGLDGVGYVTKCLGMSGADTYESAKFGSKSSGLMLSHGAEKLLRAKVSNDRRFIERSEKKSRKQSKQGRIHRMPSTHLRDRQQASRFVARGELSSSALTLNRAAFQANAYAFHDLIDERAAQKAETPKAGVITRERKPTASH